MQKDHTLLLRENTEFLKNELKSKDEIVDIYRAVWAI